MSDNKKTRRRRYALLHHSVDVITTLDIAQLNKFHSELKYHEKMKNSDEEHPPLNRYVE